MDPSGVLLAIEEQKKWRERRKRIQDRIRQVNRRKVTLSKELDRVRKKVVEYNRLLGNLKERMIERSSSRPIVQRR